MYVSDLILNPVLQTHMPTLSAFDFMDHPFLDASQDTLAGYQVVSTNDSDVESVAAFVVDQFNLREDEDELYTMMQIASAHSQVSYTSTSWNCSILAHFYYAVQYIA